MNFTTMQNRLKWAVTISLWLLISSCIDKQEENEIVTKLIFKGKISELSAIGVESVENGTVLILNKSSVKRLVGTVEKRKRYLLVVGNECKKIAFVEKEGSHGDWEFFLTSQESFEDYYIYEFTGGGDFPFMTFMPGTVTDE